MGWNFLEIVPTRTIAETDRCVHVCAELILSEAERTCLSTWSG